MCKGHEWRRGERGVLYGTERLFRAHPQASRARRKFRSIRKGQSPPAPGRQRSIRGRSLLLTTSAREAGDGSGVFHMPSKLKTLFSFFHDFSTIRVAKQKNHHVSRCVKNGDSELKIGAPGVESPRVRHKLKRREFSLLPFLS